MYNNNKPSLAGVRSTGPESRRRTQPAPAPQPAADNKVSTQRPNNPTPSGRGYA